MGRQLWNQLSIHPLIIIVIPPTGLIYRVRIHPHPDQRPELANVLLGEHMESKTSLTNT